MKEYKEIEGIPREKLFKSFLDLIGQFTIYGQKYDPEQIKVLFGQIQKRCALCEKLPVGFAVFQPSDDQVVKFGGIAGKSRMIFYGACADHAPTNELAIERLERHFIEVC